MSTTVRKLGAVMLTATAFTCSVVVPNAASARGPNGGINFTFARSSGPYGIGHTFVLSSKMLRLQLNAFHTSRYPLYSSPRILPQPQIVGCQFGRHCLPQTDSCQTQPQSTWCTRDHPPIQIGQIGATGSIPVYTNHNIMTAMPRSPATNNFGTTPPIVYNGPRLLRIRWRTCPVGTTAHKFRRLLQ
jgi:hypothetical protein